MDTGSGQHRATAAHDTHYAEPRPRGGALVVLRHDAERTEIAALLRKRFGTALEVRTASDAIACLGNREFELVVSERDLTDRSGVELLGEMRRLRPAMSRALLADPSDSNLAVDAINRGGVSVLIPRPWSSASLDALLGTNAETKSPTLDTHIATHDTKAVDGIVGRSRPMLELMDMIARIGSSDCAVLITGETGTGKELVGRAIHQASARSTRVFAAVNSAAFPETLLESELFGHRRGSFTGATHSGKGLFAHADGGTVFLDEVAEMPLSMQAKLLRFLQTGEIRPVGAEAPRIVDARVVSATNKTLEEEVSAGRFREDLFYRLAVIPVEVPALRDRIEDVPLLARHFLARVSARAGHRECQLDDSAIDLLMSHDWPGNVRELENVIERSFALTRSDRIRAEDLPRMDRTRSVVRGPQEPATPGIESLPMIERRHIIETLDRVGWNRRRAAEILEISTTTLWRRLKEFGIDGRNTQDRAALTQ